MVTSTAFDWDVPDASTPIRQGDLLICRIPHNGIIEEICLVITADCDISKGKFGKQLACLRVIRLAEYLRTIWARRKLRKSVTSETEKIRQQLAKWHSQKIGSDSSLTAQAVTEWVKREDPEAICTALGVSEKKLKLALSSFRSALSALENYRAEDNFRQLTNFRAALQNLDIQDCVQEAVKQAQGDLLPEDIFLLPHLPQLEIGSAVVLLREVVGVQYESVCYRASDAISAESFLRIGRLQPVYKYAVSQAFGSLYSRIGLPDDYERICKEMIGRLHDLDWK